MSKTLLITGGHGAFAKKLQQYNIRVLPSISKGSRTDIENELLYLHAHDMFENIEGSKQNAN